MSNEGPHSSFITHSLVNPSLTHLNVKDSSIKALGNWGTKQKQKWKSF